MIPTWFRVAKDYPNITRGLTIPFLLGSLRHPPGALSDPETSQGELRALLRAMRDETPDGYQVTISRCGNIGQLVVAVEHAHPAPSGTIRLPSPSMANRALYCAPIYGSDITDLESLAVELWRIHGPVISEGRFSYHHGAWHSFDDAEPEHLRALLAPRWLVGASYDATDDQTERFIAEGIWKNGYDDKYLDVVRSMRPGERIAIKASYTRKHGLPFDNGGGFVSVVGIKAVGTIVENLGDGQVVRVHWAPIEPVREWYFFTDRATVWRVMPGSWKTDALIAFVFEHTPQDLERFRRARGRGSPPAGGDRQ